MKKTTVLTVPDMTCGHCEMSVTEALGELDGVERAKADHVTGRVEITHEEGAVAEGRFRDAVGEAGYTVQT